MNEQEKIKLQFESYIKKYNVVLDMAKRFNVTPEEITSFLFEVGIEALSKTEKIFKEEFGDKTNPKNILTYCRNLNEIWKKINPKIKIERKSK